jgi:hypothetical protein
VAASPGKQLPGGNRRKAQGLCIHLERHSGLGKDQEQAITARQEAGERLLAVMIFPILLTQTASLSLQIPQTLPSSGLVCLGFDGDPW